MKQHDILNDRSLLQLRNEGLLRLSELFHGVEGKHAFVLFGVTAQGKSDMYMEPEKWMDEALDDLSAKTDSLLDEFVFRPLSVNPWPYGVHFIDSFFGAKPYELQGEKDNWQAENLSIPVGQLEQPDIASHPSFILAQRLAAAFTNARVSLPLFAPPVLSSPLNIALNLFGQEFLIAMLSEPEKARHDLRIITDTIKWLHKWYQKNIPSSQLQMVETCGRIQPPGHGQICGCSTQLLSGEQYGEFIAPLDQEILALYPCGGMIHLCGAHSQHIPTWKKMSSLCALQLNDRAVDDLPLFLSGLRQNQILYAHPCATMPISKIMEISGGHRTVLLGDIHESIPLKTPKS